jgi:hypothetical protein
MDGPSAHPTSQAFTIVRRDVLRPLREIGVIAIPNARDSDFDHAAFDPKTRRVFIAHTARDCLEVVDHDSQRHIATLPGFSRRCRAVADDGEILTTNRGAATISRLDAAACVHDALRCREMVKRGKPAGQFAH